MEEDQVIRDPFRSQREELIQPFPDQYIDKKGKYSYIKHGQLAQRLIQVVGPFNFFVKELIFDSDQVLTGAIVRLELYIDGEYQIIEQTGAIEHRQDNNAQNLKHAESDGFKRCCAKLGLGLQTWNEDQYWLHKKFNVTPFVSTLKETGQREGGVIDHEENE